MRELAPPAHPMLRRLQRLDAIRAREELIAKLTAEQRLEVAALTREDLGGLTARYVADELALTWHRSPRQASNRVDVALLFADFPAVHALIGDGTWLIDHADAVLDELAGSGLDHDQQLQVLALVLTKPGGRTPWQLRAAVRTAIVVLFPEQAAEKAEKAKVDRDVQTYVDAPGRASLFAHGPTSAVAAMMASLDTLIWPPAADDPRTAAQRRFDTLYDLVCGRTQPGQWQVQLLMTLATAEGRDELPGEIPGFGPLPAPVCRELLTGASIRRVIVDDMGQLVAVDATVHRPDLVQTQPVLAFVDRASAPAPRRSHHDDLPAPGEPAEPDVEPDVEPDPDRPSLAEQHWLDWTTNDDRVHAEHTALHRAAAAARGDHPAADVAPDPTAVQGPGRLLVPAPRGPLLPASRMLLVPPVWSPEALSRTLQRLRTDPLPTLDLHADAYAVPARLKRHLVLRDRTCVFPGCPRRADQCDKDHLIPWPRGSTSESNLASECEHHHQAKHGYFTVTRLPDGTIRWTLPTGRAYDHTPRPVLDSWPTPPNDE